MRVLSCTRYIVHIFRMGGRSRKDRVGTFRRIDICPSPAAILLVGMCDRVPSDGLGLPLGEYYRILASSPVDSEYYRNNN